jgi:serine/threonine protein kinase
MCCVDAIVIRRFIGQGGMGCIYLADDICALKPPNCLKEVELDRSLPEEMIKEARDQFLREATVLARLGSSQSPQGFLIFFPSAAWITLSWIISPARICEVNDGIPTKW